MTAHPSHFLVEVWEDAMSTNASRRFFQADNELKRNIHSTPFPETIENSFESTSSSSQVVPADTLGVRFTSCGKAFLKQPKAE